MNFALYFFWYLYVLVRKINIIIEEQGIEITTEPIKTYSTIDKSSTWIVSRVDEDEDPYTMAKTIDTTTFYFDEEINLCRKRVTGPIGGGGSLIYDDQYTERTY